MDCALYRQGQRSQETRNLVKMASEAKADPAAFVWMGLLEPSQTDLVGVARIFGIHPLAVEDAVKAHQRPKLEIYDSFLFLVMRTVWFEENPPSIDTGELMVFLGSDFVVTVRHGRGVPLGEVRQRLEQTSVMGEHGPPAVLHAICDSVVDRYTEAAHEISDAVEELEAAVFAPELFEDSARIYRLKQEVHEFRRAVSPLVEAIATLAEMGGCALIGAGIRPFFSDVRDHILRVVDALDACDRQLADIVAAHLAQVGVQQNADMRRISAYVALAAVPTLIAGIYGMNFTNMPELHWRYGYFLVLGFMVLICVLLWRSFKRNGWL